MLLSFEIQLRYCIVAVSAAIRETLKKTKAKTENPQEQPLLLPFI